MTDPKTAMAHVDREIKLALRYKHNAKLEGTDPELVQKLCSVIYYSGVEPASELINSLYTVVSLIEGSLLSPITNDPEEWDEIPINDASSLWRSNRHPSVWSVDAGKHWFAVPTEWPGPFSHYVGRLNESMQVERIKES